jgi:hypothetical protein
MPSPPADRPDRTDDETIPRRATSLPPESTRKKRSSTLTSVIKKMRIASLEDNPEGGTVEIEELSPDAIIPDSITIMRDPEVEIQDDNTAEAGKSWEDGIQMDGVDDDGMNEMSDGNEMFPSPPPPRIPKKRKFNLADEERYDRLRKRTASPGSFSPERGYR